MFNQGGDTTTATSSNSLMTYAEPFYKDLMTRAQGISKKPYVPYKNPRLANFGTDTNSAFQMIRDQASAGAPDVDAALASAGGLADYEAFSGGALNPGTVSTGSFGFEGMPGNLDEYMSPYTENVLDVNKQRAERRFQEQQVGRESDAVQAGAFGGSRRFVQDSLARRDYNEQMDTMDAQGLEAAYNSAADRFTTDEERRLRAFEGDQGRALTADTGNAERGLQAGMATEEGRRLGAGLGLEAVRTQGDLAQLRQNMNMNRVEALSGVGTKMDQRNQAGLDIAYNDFQRQQGHPGKSLGDYASILFGVPSSGGTTTATETQPAPNFLSQLLGLTLAGTGLVNTYR